MEDTSPRSLADLAGVPADYVERLEALGILPRAGEVDDVGAVRRIRVVQGLERGGLPLEGIAGAIAAGALSLDFVDQPSYDRFAGQAQLTFRQLSDRTNIPLDVLLVIREAMGSSRPEPDDRVRETELRVVPLVETVLDAGVRPELVERTLRVAGDGMRRLAETEADWWRTDILGPLVRAGVPIGEIGRRTAPFATAVTPVTDEAVLAIYHGQQAQAWLGNILDGFEAVLAHAGLHTRVEQPPAIAFFDLSGYTRLTEERGDAAAADVAGAVARIIGRVSAGHGGTAVKWVGDGTMVHFRSPGAALDAALHVLDAVESAGLPRAHVGIHAGPVFFQEGDYFGRTVNAAARIADVAGAGELVVSEAVVEAAVGSMVALERIGPVDLKGLAEPLVLFRARRPT